MGTFHGTSVPSRANVCRRQAKSSRTISGRRNHRSTPARRLICSCQPIRPSTPRPTNAWPRIAKPDSRSLTLRPNIGGSLEKDQSDRIHVCHSRSSASQDERQWITQAMFGDGLQAEPGSREEVGIAQWLANRPRRHSRSSIDRLPSPETRPRRESQKYRYLFSAFC